MTSRAWEAVFIAAIAFAILVGGRSLLAEIAQFRGPAAAALLLIAAALSFGLRRNAAPRAPAARLRATRDATFLVAILAALAFVYAPARWASGASVAALEFALALELLVRLAPAAP